MGGVRKTVKAKLQNAAWLLSLFALHGRMQRIEVRTYCSTNCRAIPIITWLHTPVQQSDVQCLKTLRILIPTNHE